MKPRVGDTRWLVEWVTEFGWTDETKTEYNSDRNTVKRRGCKSREEAEKLAKEVYPLDVYGSVAFWPQTFTAYDAYHATSFPHVGYWVDDDDAEHYEGEQ